MTAPYSPPIDEVTTAVLTLLRGAGRPVYDGAYAGDPLRPDYWYAILYAPSGGNADATPNLDADTRTVTVPYQVTTVSNLRNQCQFGGRVLRDRILARTPTGWTHPLPLPAGWQVIDRRPDPAMPGVERVGDAPNAVFNQPARYLLTIAPD